MPRSPAPAGEGLTRGEILELAKWQGKVDILLQGLRDGVVDLQTNSATKEKLKSEKELLLEKIGHIDTEELTKRMTAAEQAATKLTAEFQVKSSAWGLVGGLLPAMGMLLYMIITAYM